MCPSVVGVHDVINRVSSVATTDWKTLTQCSTLGRLHVQAGQPTGPLGACPVVSVTALVGLQEYEYILGKVGTR